MTGSIVRRLVLAVGLALLPAPPAQLSAQEAGKRPLEIADYRMWRSIDGESISDDGRWVAWSYSRVRGQDTLHIRSTDGERSIVRERASNPVFSDDGRWVAFRIAPPIDELLELEREGESVPWAAGLIDLETGEERSWEGIEDFGFAPGSSHLHLIRSAADDDAEHDGTDLILRNLRRGYEELIGSVASVAWNRDGDHLAWTVDAADDVGNGLYLLDASTGARVALDNAEQSYSRMTWSEDGSAIAVLRGETPDDRVERENVLLAFTDPSDPTRFELTARDGLADGWVISERSSLTWNEDATTLFVGSRPQSEELDEWDDDGLPLADVNIFHWQDDRIQTEQQRALGRDRNRTWVAAAHLDDGRIVPIADERMATAQITRDGRWAIGRDATEHVSDWRPELADYWRVDTRSGERTLVLDDHLRTLGLSPDSRFMAYWSDGHVHLYDIAEDTHRNLTEGAPVSFVDLEYDYFGERPPYGIAGWTEDGEGLVLYHRYDIWLQPLDGGTATNLTGGRGAAEEIDFRVVWTDPEARTIDLDAPLLLSGFGERTKNDGFFRLEDGRLVELTWEPKRFGFPQKAADADRYLFTVQSWQDFPDLWLTEGEFSNRERVTDANPQQEEFLWGSRILFDYTLSDGTELQGTLAIPESWSEGDAPLPMIVRFYEQYSQDLHAYPTPMYRHQPNFAGYVSRGYLLMQPDVHFRLRTTHSDMLEAIEAATRAVIDMGYADPARIGLSGHSFSGGGGAYIAARSDMFAAVAHGAAPINLVSEFNQLFVGSGTNNHSYDIYGQGRYATNPYDDFDLYWEQSPIAHVETMDTPVLYLHGESDPIVNWEQGLEWYNALRFLEKPVIWLSYPGEGHGLSRLENRIDFQYRLKQFFDHHLLGEPAPSWMTDGIPQLDKDRHLRDFAPRIFRSGEGDSGEASDRGAAGADRSGERLSG